MPWLRRRPARKPWRLRLLVLTAFACRQILARVCNRRLGPHAQPCQWCAAITRYVAHKVKHLKQKDGLQSGSQVNSFVKSGNYHFGGDKDLAVGLDNDFA